MRLVLLALMILGLSACNGGPPGPEVLSADPATERSLAQGKVVGGLSKTGAHVWRGIPFAQAPSGALRWKAPRPPLAHEGTREALEFGPPCPQLTTYLDAAQGVEAGQLRGSEDCLNLDIYAPTLAADSMPAGGPGLPVMVWIHGGGNTWGNSAQFDGGLLAAQERVVVVTIQYRLGPIGWFAHEAIRATAETADDASANFGTLDMIAALEWVRANIETFGGDPGNVTIFGESAGGHNVASLIASPRAGGLFHRAILQSGGVETVPLGQAEVTGGGPNGEISAREATAKLWAGAGRAEADLAAATPSEVAEFLRSLPLETVVRAYDDGNGQLSVPRVIADGIVLPADGILAAMSRPGGFNAVPVMTGTNLDETKLFNMLRKEYASRYLGIIIRLKDPLLFDVVSDYQSLNWRVRAVDEPANAMTAAGHGDVFAYRFDWDEQGTQIFTDFSEAMGAAHAIEIPFVFGNFRLFGRLDSLIFNEANAPGRERLSKAVMSYWAQFARTGDPASGGAGDLTEWQRWNPAAGAGVLVLDTQEGGGIRHETQSVSRASLLSALESDSRITDDAMRCRVFDAVVAWADELEPARATFHGGACTKPN